MSVLAEVLITLAVIMLVFAVTAVLVVRMLVKRMRRSRALSTGLLRTRAQLSTGPHRRVLKLHVRLGDTLDSAQAAIGLAMRGGGPRGELPQLFRRIQREGLALESQLRLMESESDSATLAAALPVATRRVDEVVDMVSRLRSVVSSGLGALSDDTLRALRAEVDREVAALTAGVQELRSLNADNDQYDSPLHPPIDHAPKGNKS